MGAQCQLVRLLPTLVRNFDPYRGPYYDILRMELIVQRDKIFKVPRGLFVAGVHLCSTRPLFIIVIIISSSGIAHVLLLLNLIPSLVLGSIPSDCDLEIFKLSRQLATKC